MAIQIAIEGYDSFEQIAVGGMAAVYKARKVSIDKTVAIKVLFPYLASDESFIDRFQREAMSAAKLQHENVVNVIDFGESGGSYYIVMEYYEGKTLADLLKEQQRIPFDIAAGVLFDVCLGLEAAHSKDIVHRDIKPANVIYTYQGGVKLADFGLAKKSDTMTMVTQPGKVLGTPAYMSPEQAAGQSVGPQSDIFSLGVVAFEMFCNKRPFEGKTYSDVLERIQTQEVPSLTNENPLIQPDFESIITKMLKKDLSLRYGSISDVIADFERAMEKFDIKRDRRRLRAYVRDPNTYEQSFNDKMINKCLSQGTFFMQKGKTHLEEAMIEFKKILYLDPTNERARKNLARIMSEYHDGNATITLEGRTVRAPDDRKKRRPEKKIERAPEPARRIRDHAGSPAKRGLPDWIRLAYPLIGVALIGGAFLGWQRWAEGKRLGAGNSPPVISTPSRLTVSEGERVEFAVRAMDTDGDRVRVYGEKMPQGASLTESGLFAWNVGYDQAGVHKLIFMANDGKKIGSAATTVEVTDRPLSLAFEKVGPLDTREGEGISVELKARSQINEPVTFSLEDAPSGMAIRGNRLVWKPQDGQTGAFNIQVTGSDGLASATQTVSIRVKPEKRKEIARASTGRVDWILPKLANIYVDGALKVREDTYLSIELPAGKHTVRAELLDGITAFEERVNVEGGVRTTLEPPRLAYGRLSVYYLGGVGEFYLNGRKFSSQPPFTGVVVPTGRYAVSCKMFKTGDSREFHITVNENEETVIEYEIGREPQISHVHVDR